MEPDKPENSETFLQPDERVEANPEVEDFLHRLTEKQDIRRPKPSEEAIAAALQAIQRLGARIQAEQEATGATGAASEAAESSTCNLCGHQNLTASQFCSMCGAQLGVVGSEPRATAPGAQHHYHHHYHHHFVAGGEGEAPGVGRLAAMAGAAGQAPREAPKIRTAAPGQGLSRAEATIRQMTHDWAAACNNRQIEDLLDFYSADALVMRPNVPPVRGTAAIREFFVGALEAGLGDVEMEALRVELLGDVAYQAGRCKMLVPVTMGKRREERGKYVIVFAKEKNGQWKAVVDSWSSDLGLSVGEVPAAPIGTPKSRR